MNPFAIASKFGYKPQDILSFAAKSLPGFEDKIKYALAAGYSADEILKFLQNAFQDGKSVKRYSQKAATMADKYGGQGTEFEKQERARIRNMRMDDLFDPNKTMATLVGAGVGALSGGPAGAISGAIGAREAYDDVLKKYEQYTNEGGKLSIGDYLKAFIKGGGKAFGTYIAIDAAKGLFNQLQQGKEKGNLGQLKGPETKLTESGFPIPKEPEQQVEQPIVQQPSEPVKETVTDVQETIQTPQGQDLKASYDIFEKRGQGRIIDAISTQITPEEGYSALRKLYGVQFLKDLERQHKKPAEQIITEAFEYAKQKSTEGQKEPQVQSEEIEAEKIQDSGENLEDIPEKKYSIDPIKAEAFSEIFTKNTPLGQEAGVVQKSVKPIENALKSSNVMGAFYDDETNKMRTVFRSGDAYEYDNINLDELEKVTGGKAKPITEGSTEYGFWFPEKKKSVGAAFDKFIKKKSEEFPYRKLEKKDLTESQTQLQESVRTITASNLFEPFKKQRKKGQQREKGKVLRDMEPALQDMDDDFIQDIVEFIEDKVNLKTPIKIKRLQKEFKKEFL